MQNVSDQLNEFRNALELNATAYGVSLDAEALALLSKYYDFLNTWNARLHLVAPTSPREFATRHILESLMLLEHLPHEASVADIGSGAGLPIIPCLIARPDLRAVLIEASPKKAVFLNEVLREVASPTTAAGTARARVVAKRFEAVPAPAVDYITCRALERFEEILPTLLAWAPVKSTLMLFGGEGLERRIEANGVGSDRILIPKSERRFLFIAKSRASNDDRALKQS